MGALILPYSQLAPVIIGAGAIVCVIALIAMISMRQTNNFMFRVMLPIISALLAYLALADQVGDLMAVMCLFGAYLMLEDSLWVFCADIAQRYRISAFTVCGFSRCAMAIGTFASWVSDMPLRMADWPLGNMDAFLPVAFVAITLGYSLLPKSAEMRRTLKFGEQCPAFLGNDTFEPAGGDVLAAAEGTGADDGASPAPAGIDAGDAVQATGEDAKAPDARRSTAPDTPPAQDEPERGSDQPQQQLGRFKRKCMAVADTFLLSRKETEVLFLLAKGRNSAAIQEALFISPGTANTHMRNIYRKLDVHSQQELIRLVEGIDAD